MSHQPRGLSVSHCARAMGVDPSTFRKWIRKGYVSVYRTPGGRIGVPEAELARLMQPTEPMALASPKQGSAGHQAALEELRRAGIG